MKRNIFIFGASRGIGGVFAKEVDTERYNAFLFSRNSPKIEGTTFSAVDFFHLEELKEVLLKVAKKAGIVHNLVFFQRYRGDRGWNGEMRVSLEATKVIIDTLENFYCDTSSIVIIGSNGGRFVATEQPIEYAVAKAGLEQLVRYYAVKLGERGVRINAVSPAVILKPENIEFYSSNKNLMEVYEKAIPLGRMGEARDVCEVVSFLLNVSFITGQNIVVDGGLSLQTHDGLAKKISGIKDEELIHPIRLDSKNE